MFTVSLIPLLSVSRLSHYVAVKKTNKNHPSEYLWSDGATVCCLRSVRGRCFIFVSRHLHFCTRVALSVSRWLSHQTSLFCFVLFFCSSYVRSRRSVCVWSLCSSEMYVANKNKRDVSEKNTTGNLQCLNCVDSNVGFLCNTFVSLRFSVIKKKNKKKTCTVWCHPKRPFQMHCLKLNNTNPPPKKQLVCSLFFYMSAS